MTDIVSVVLAVDASQVKAGAVSLDELAKAGIKVEGATQKATVATRNFSSATATLVTAAKAAAATFGLWKLAGLVKESALLAARFETMGVVMGVAGNNAGYTRDQMEALSVSLQKSGISMLESRNVLAQLATAHIDLSKAAVLGRAAQDVAVVGNLNSSETLARMVDGIQSGNVEILKTMGLNVSFEASYKRLASQLGTTTEKLSQNQKMMARANAVTAEAASYTGVYEASMTTAAKQIKSSERYVEDFKLMIGQTFNEALTVAVMGFVSQIKGANTELSELEKNGKLDEWGANIVDTLAFVGDAFGSVSALARMAGVSVAWFKGIYELTDDLQRGKISPDQAQEQRGRLNAQLDAELSRLRENTRDFRTAVEDRRAAQAELGTPAGKAKIAAEEQTRIAAARASQEKATAEESARMAIEAGEAAEKTRLKAIESTISGLNKESNLLGLSAAQAVAYNLTVLGATPAQIEFAKALQQTTTARENDLEIIEKERAANDDLIKSVKDEQAEVIRGLMTQDAAIRTAAALKVERVLMAAEESVEIERNAAAMIANIHKEADKQIADLNDERAKAMKEAAADLGQAFTHAFDDAVVAGAKFSDVLKGLLEDIQRIALRVLVTKPLENALSTALGGLFGGSGGGNAAASAFLSGHAKGNAFSGGNVIPFARGGVVSGPTLFPMAKGAGLMGEAGPEAIIPLKRGANGALGVQASGGGTLVQIVDQRGTQSAPVDVQRQMVAGREQIRVLIRDQVEAAISSGGLDRAMASKFGIRSSGAR